MYAVSYDLVVQTVFVTMALLHVCVYCKAFFTLGLYIKISIYGPITEMSINFNRSEMQIFLFCTSPILLPQPHCPSSIHKSVLQEYVQIFENEIQS